MADETKHTNTDKKTDALTTIFSFTSISKFDWTKSDYDKSY